MAETKLRNKQYLFIAQKLHVQSGTKLTFPNLRKPVRRRLGCLLLLLYVLLLHLHQCSACFADERANLHLESQCSL